MNGSCLSGLRRRCTDFGLVFEHYKVVVVDHVDDDVVRSVDFGDDMDVAARRCEAWRAIEVHAPRSHTAQGHRR